MPRHESADRNSAIMRTPTCSSMTDADIEATKAPLMDHLIELRARLIKAVVAFLAMFVICFFFAKDIYNILLVALPACGGRRRPVDLYPRRRNISSRRSGSRFLLRPSSPVQSSSRRSTLL